jgi:flagellin
MTVGPIGSAGPSTTAQRNFAVAGRTLAASFEKLATGFRINRGADDPAGLITSEQLRAMLAALEAEASGAERADAAANVAEGALSEVSNLLGDAAAAAVAAANTGGMSQAERDAHQFEIDSALQSIDRIAATTTFNGRRVLDGSLALSVGGGSIEIGSAAASDLGQVTIDGEHFRLSDARSGGRLDSSAGGAPQGTISAAVEQVAEMRGRIGAFQKDVIGPHLRSSATAYENTAAANSVIRDTDYAAEISVLARGQLLRRSTAAVLGIANSLPGRALNLLA